MTVWDEYFARYRDFSALSPEDEDQLEAMEKNLVADFSAHYPPSSQEDVAWFRNALEHEQRKWFVAFVFQEPRKVTEALYGPMMRAAVCERAPSKNHAFVEPCVATFGLRRVNETLLELFENGTDLEKAGAVQAMYWAILINLRDSDQNRPDASVVFGSLGNLWMRQRCLLLQEFVINPSVSVRQRIIPHLDLKNVSSYPEQLRSFVPQAIQIAEESSGRLYPPAPRNTAGLQRNATLLSFTCNRAIGNSRFPGGQNGGINREGKKRPCTTPQIVRCSFAEMVSLTVP